MKKTFKSLALFCLSFTALAQPDARFDKDLLSKEFHRGRREALRALMPANSVAVFFANPIRNRSNDVDYQYSQDPNLYYLTGWLDPNAMLLVFKEPIKIDTISTNEILFVPPRNPVAEKWTGPVRGANDAEREMGLRKSFINFQLEELKINFQSFSKIYQLPTYEDVRDDKDDRGDLYDLIRLFKSLSGGNADLTQLEKWMGELREVKQPEEIVLLRKAIDASCDGHRELMKALTNEMTEYQAQAVLEYCFKKNGSEYCGYPSIVGGGGNSCILHYATNRKAIGKNDLLLFDAGAEYHGYTADVTRTVPANGKYSEEQKKIYNIVLEAQEAGIKACKAGNAFRAPHVATTTVIMKRLLELGIIKQNAEIAKYFFHGTSHYLGLDVHDPGTYGKLKANSVITVEPGIYIPEGSPCDPKWWNIGVRIEDDILITDGEPENLSAKVPRKVEEIEALMKELSIFDKK